jgi:glutamate N-acetyltransferase/amino-acid N-acetyltransferase
MLGINENQVLPFSTGVIGEQLPMERVLAGIAELRKTENECDWVSAAKAIMTTDTVAKGVSETVDIDGTLITITGIAKGSGMICPDMATMLSYVVTDAHISTPALQQILIRGTDASFNRITVDSDTSTNDALILAATGASPLPEISDVESTAAMEFSVALQNVLIKLATSVIRDAEGATKFVTVKATDGKSESDCEAIAYSVAHSPLVKTALFASDPNWGRILMAVGKAPVEELNVDIIDVQINGVQLVKQGQPADGYTEESGKLAFSEPEIEITICLNAGSSSYHVWTSDLSSEYVSINADYRS